MATDCCVSAATADYDLTGQILWPAARLLADYLAAHLQLLEGRRGACELGAGLGLAGLTASRVCWGERRPRGSSVHPSAQQQMSHTV